jgi:hypothetical protein
MREPKLPQRVVGFQLSYSHTFEFSAPIGVFTEGAHFALPFFVVARPRFRCLTISSWVLGLALSMRFKISSPRCLTYLSDEYRLRAKQISNHKSAMPKAMKQPKKHSLES